MIGKVLRWYRARCRKSDIEVLWPQFLTRAYGLGRLARYGGAAVAPKLAGEAFLIHCKGDPAWRDFTEEEIVDTIEELILDEEIRRFGQRDRARITGFKVGSEVPPERRIGRGRWMSAGRQRAQDEEEEDDQVS